MCGLFKWHVEDDHDPVKSLAFGERLWSRDEGWLSSAVTMAQAVPNALCCSFSLWKFIGIVVALQLLLASTQIFGATMEAVQAFQEDIAASENKRAVVSRHGGVPATLVWDISELCAKAATLVTTLLPGSLVTVTSFALGATVIPAAVATHGASIGSAAMAAAALLR